MSKAKGKETLYDEFNRMSAYVAEGMEKNPRNDREFAQQAGKAYGRSLVFSLWFIGKLFKYTFKLSRRLLTMVFGRGKKKVDPAFMSPAMEQQMQAFQNMQQQQMGYPQQQGYPQNYPSNPPVQQQPMGYPPQPPSNVVAPPPVNPQVQQLQQQMQMPPIQRPPVYSGAIMQPNMLFEQLMQSFIALVDKFKECDQRLTTVEAAVNDIYDRLNLIQGVQPASTKRIKFERGK